MRRKITASTALAVALAGAAASVLVGHAGQATSVASAATPDRTFTLTESGTGVYQDEATKAAPDFSQPIPAGDTIVFKADVLKGSAIVGEARGECTSVLDAKFVCNVFFTITKHGTLALQVPFDLANPEGDYVVTGGTGEFAGLHGWAHFTTLSNGDEVHTFHLTGN